MTAPVSGAELRALFDQARTSVVRIETLPAYDVGGDEAESITAWREGRPRPERSVRTNGYLQRVAAVVARGVTWERLRLISSPPSEYEAWELVSYRESQAVGERVLIAPRHQLSDMEPPMDTWAIDGSDVVVLDYADDGTFLGLRRATDAERLAQERLTVVIRRCATTLDEYLAGPGSSYRAP